MLDEYESKLEKLFLISIHKYYSKFYGCTEINNVESDGCILTSDILNSLIKQNIDINKYLVKRTLTNQLFKEFSNYWDITRCRDVLNYKLNCMSRKCTNIDRGVLDISVMFTFIMNKLSEEQLIEFINKWFDDGLDIILFKDLLFFCTFNKMKEQIIENTNNISNYNIRLTKVEKDLVKNKNIISDCNFKLTEIKKELVGNKKIISDCSDKLLKQIETQLVENTLTNYEEFSIRLKKLESVVLKDKDYYENLEETLNNKLNENYKLLMKFLDYYENLEETLNNKLSQNYKSIMWFLLLQFLILIIIIGIIIILFIIKN